MFFSFPMNDISMHEKKKHKTLNIKIWVASTHAVQIWDHLNKNWSSYCIMKLYNFFLETSCIIGKIWSWSLCRIVIWKRNHSILNYVKKYFSLSFPFCVFLRKLKELKCFNDRKISLNSFFIFMMLPLLMFIIVENPLHWQGSENGNCFFCRGVRQPPKKEAASGVGSCYRDLRSVEYYFITITLRSALISSGSTFYSPVYGSKVQINLFENYLFIQVWLHEKRNLLLVTWKYIIAFQLLLLDLNTWNCITVCKKWLSNRNYYLKLSNCLNYKV